VSPVIHCMDTVTRLCVDRIFHKGDQLLWIILRSNLPSVTSNRNTEWIELGRKRSEGDRFSTILSTVGMNFRKLIKFVRDFLCYLFVGPYS